METIIILLATVLLGVIAVLSAYAVGILDTKAGSVVVAFLILFLAFTTTDAIGMDVAFLTQSFAGWLFIGALAMAFSEGLRWAILDEEVMLVPAPVFTRYTNEVQEARRSIIGVRIGRFAFVFATEVQPCWV